MPFLVWDNQQDAKDSLIAINTVYGLPLLALNGYKADRWDILIKSRLNNNHGFTKPEERLDMGMGDLMPMLVGDRVEYDEMPEEFKPPDEDE